MEERKMCVGSGEKQFHTQIVQRGELLKTLQDVRMSWHLGRD